MWRQMHSIVDFIDSFVCFKAQVLLALDTVPVYPPLLSQFQYCSSLIYNLFTVWLNSASVKSFPSTTPQTQL